MKKLTCIAVLASAAMSFPVLATTVQFGSAASSERQVVSFESTPLASGDLVWAGVFSSVGSFTYNPALTVLANVNNMVSLGGFQAFGFGVDSYNSTNGTWNTTESSANSLTITTNGINSTQQASGQIVDNTGTPGGGTQASYFDNKQLYLVIFNGTTVATSTEAGIFTSTTASVWQFKANNQGLGGDVGNYSTATTTAVNAVDGAGSVNSSSSPNQLVLSPAPEPSSLVALFGGGGVLAMLRRRRSE